MDALLPVLLFLTLLVLLASGFPVAFALAGAGLLFVSIGALSGVMQVGDLALVPARVYDVMQSISLMAVPLFILMGLVLERSRIAGELLATAERCLRHVRGGLALAVILVGALIAACTGIVGATVVTLGVLSLPAMLKSGYDPRLATGTIAASGTLGQIIPPSVVLVLLGDLLNVAVGDLFMAAVVPGALLVLAYIAYVLVRVRIQPALAPLPPPDPIPVPGRVLLRAVATGLLPAAALMVLVLGVIMAGVATPTEAAACGAVGALVIAAGKRRLTWAVLRGAAFETATMTAMVFTILAASQVFTVAFRGIGGEVWLTQLITGLDPGPVMTVVAIMALMFVLGFFLDFLEICFIVVPIVVPILAHVGWTSSEDLVLIGVLMAINLQTSFLTPPFGFSLFYLKGCAPPEIRSADIYRGAWPFVLIQLVVIAVVGLWPDLVLWLPRLLAR